MNKNATETSIDYRLWLIEELESRKRKNASYSLRSFSKSTGVSTSLLSQIVNGKSPLSFKTAAKIANRLAIPPEERDKLFQAVSEQNKSAKSGSKQSRTIKKKYRQLQLNHFQILSEWYYYAILGLSYFTDAKFDANWVSKRLGITRLQADRALDKLLNFGLIKRRNKTGFYQVDGSLTTTRDISSSAIRKYHRANLLKAEESLEQIAIDERYLSSITIPVNENEYEEVKREIIKFRRRLIAKYSKPKKVGRVYTLALQFFPIDFGEAREKGKIT